MLSRLGCVLGRLSPATTRGLASRSARALSTSVPLASNAVPAPPDPKPAETSGGGLSGFLHEKTGATGAGTLGVGVAAYLLSKEIYIITSETVVAVVMAGVVLAMVNKMAKPTAEYLDARSEKILAMFNEGRHEQIRELQDAIKTESNVENMLAVRQDVFEILKENNALRLEEEYRRRQHEVNREVKKRLDYQVEVEKLQREFEQSRLVQWLEKAVTDSVKGKQDESLSQCISELKQLSTA